METEAKTNGHYSLPAQYEEAMTLARHGAWDYMSLRATPYWLMERVRFIWKLDSLAQEKQMADIERNRKEALNG